MWNASALSISPPFDLCTGDRYTLSDEICAMQLLPGENGTAVLGPVVTMPKGAQLDACGPGFNDRTLKVRSDGAFYFVFLQDLDAQRKPLARAAGVAS